ncbi:MAG: ubiquinone anaerobic biosynthesis accessory factor UbiT [Rhodanobacter sp.]
MQYTPERLVLGRVRAAIDRVDDGLVVLLAARRRLAGVAASLKPRVGLPPRDLVREQQVRTRAGQLARRLGLPRCTSDGLLDLAIGDACARQGLRFDAGQGAAVIKAPMMPPIMLNFSASSFAPPLLRLLPPPRRFAPLLRIVPLRWQHRLLERAMARVLAVPLSDGALDFMRGRRLGIEVSDLQLRWVLEWREQRLCVTDGEPEASVRGSATDLLLLASRLEDADTLFFHRALDLTGDTELGLTARNLLERLPWESVPLGLRIALNRGARLAQSAREAHRQHR